MSAALLFGKLPTHGDFVSRGCEGTQRADLDRWLAGAMAMAHETFGEVFEARYDNAPAWRFAFPDAGGWLAGAMAPSMDSVGRRFPIFVACRTAEEAGAPGLAQACEDAIYQAFARQLDADQLHAGLLTLAEQAGRPPRLPGWWTPGNEGFPPARLAGSFPGEVVRAMLGAAGEAA